jgi:hypothetical protein
MNQIWQRQFYKYDKKFVDSLIALNEQIIDALCSSEINGINVVMKVSGVEA